MKKPHLDFLLRLRLDGSEEFYTQNEKYQPSEQKFTLAQVRDWLLRHQRQITLQVNTNNQTQFPLRETILFPELSEVHFEKLKLTYTQDYHFENNTLILTLPDIPIELGDQISLKYFYTF